MNIQIPSPQSVGNFLTRDFIKAGRTWTSTPTEDGGLRWTAKSDIPRVFDWDKSGGIDPIEAVGSSIGLYLAGKGAKAAYNKIRGKKRDMSDDPSTVEKVTDYAKNNKNALLIGAGLGAGALAIARTPEVKEKIQKVKQVLFSEGKKKFTESPGKMAALGIPIAGAGTALIYASDKTGATSKVKDVIENAAEWVKNIDLELGKKIDITGDQRAADELGFLLGSTALTSAGLYALAKHNRKKHQEDFSDKKYKVAKSGLRAGQGRCTLAKSTGKTFSEVEDQIVVKNNIWTGAARGSVIDAASKAITATGKAGLVAGGALAGYNYLDDKGYISDDLKKDVADKWNKLTGGDVSDVGSAIEGLAKPKGGIISDVRALRDALTQHGAAIDSPLTKMIAEEKGLDPETFHSNIEEYGLAGGALIAGLMARNALRRHRENKQKELNRNKDIAVAGIKQDQINSERLLNRKYQKRLATQSIKEKRGGN